MWFPKIREFCKETKIPEHYVRERVKCGEVLGFYSGNTFHIDASAFLAKIKRECRENAD